jgi:prophage regulatory protein
MGNIIENYSNHSLLNEACFLRLAQILKIIPVGKTTWWNGVKSGRFPKPVKLGGRITAWRVEDIKACIERYAQNGGK